MKTSLLIITVLSGFILLYSCGEHKEKKHKKKDKEKKEAIVNEKSPVKDHDATIDCDTTLWRYVYNPSRLEVIDYCQTVTGTIEESNADEDGDQHMLLKLDKGQDDLLTKKNMKKQKGDLVIEAVCANKVTLSKVGNTCNGLYQPHSASKDRRPCNSIGKPGERYT